MPFYTGLLRPNKTKKLKRNRKSFKISSNSKQSNNISKQNNIFNTNDINIDIEGY